MDSTKPSVVVTGISGNLGQRLAPMLETFSVVGIDVTPPGAGRPVYTADKKSTRELFLCLIAAATFVHLAFVIDREGRRLDVFHVAVFAGLPLLEYRRTKERGRESSLFSYSVLIGFRPVGVNERSAWGSHVATRSQSDLVIAAACAGATRL
jgi:nucleoside-diphosphate-sugar epimerase